MCVYRTSCSNLGLAACTTWGLSASAVCASCFELAKGEVRDHGEGLAPVYLEDYARVLILMKDKAACKAHLVAFNADLANFIHNHAYLRAKHNADNQYIRLSSALEHYERMCWFPTGHLIPLGVLTSADFLHYIRLGYVLKDYGAGIKHGEFTHRLQWQIVMRANTNGFTNANPATQGWKKTPLDLYTTLGTAGANTGSPGLWGHLFDRPSMGSDYSYPDKMHADVLALGDAPVLRHNLSRRERKRREEFITQYKNQLATQHTDIDQSSLDGNTNYSEVIIKTRELISDDWQRKNPPPPNAPPVPTAPNPVWSVFSKVLPGESADTAYQRQLNQRRDAMAAQIQHSTRANTEPRAQEKAVFDASNAQIMGAYTTKKTGTHSTDPLLPGGVQKVSGEPVVTEILTQARVASSHTGFNVSGT